MICSTRLLGTYAYSLGYDNCRFNIAKAGVIDVTAQHRFEDRTVRMEAKATADPIGGGDINKFIRVLDAERRRSLAPISGYFVSLSGFTETAVQQEEELGKRLILVGAQDVVDELPRRMLSSPEQAPRNELVGVQPLQTRPC